MAYEKRPPQKVCRKGHAMEGDNVIVRKDGYRRCRECLRAVKRRWARNDAADKRAARRNRS